MYKKGATANNGIEIAENTGGWTVHKLRHIKKDISDKMYTFKVHAEGPEINYYINSEKFFWKTGGIYQWRYWFAGQQLDL